VSPRARILAIGSGAVVVAGLVAATAWTVAARPADAGVESEPRATARVEERTLRVIDEVDGALGHGAERPLTAAAPGTVTRLPAAGDVVERGDTLWEVNGAPTLLLYGETPMWRSLSEGVTGEDVEQLEANLVELGYGGDLTVDETWDVATTTAVEAWQQATDQNVDGVVDLGDVVFEPDAVIVSGVEATRGANVGPGAPVVRVTDTERVVTARLSGSQLEGLGVGDSVDIELGDGTVATATVQHVDLVPTTAQDGSQGYGVTLTLDDDFDAAGAGPVEILLVRHEREDVLAVPVSALLALLEGGYAVERVTGSGAVDLVPVEARLFADGWVQVEGDLAAGDEVVVP
jgi:peptidoglycan hydrolase-like protein with peptidoglycan-binding domain